MKKKIYINVPEPCHENWREMTPAEQGRHCGVCTKNVIDFTKFSDKELLDFLSTQQQNICGRFDNQQLNRAIECPTIPQKYSLPSSWLLGLSLLAGTIATALPVSTYATPTVIEQSFLNEEIKNTDGDSARVIRGVVTDSSTNEGLAYVTVAIKNTNIHTFTDFDGKFLLKIPNEYNNQDILLKIHFIGYNMKEVVVANSLNSIAVSMSEAIMGVTVGYIISEDLTRWQKVKRFFRRLF